MTLMRQARKANMMQQEPVVETSLGPELLTELRGVAGQVRDLRTMLFGVGEPNAPETAQGRLSRQDARIEEAIRKSETNERDITEIKGRLNSERASSVAHWNFGKIIWALLAGLAIAMAG